MAKLGTEPVNKKAPEVWQYKQDFLKLSLFTGEKALQTMQKRKIIVTYY